jgi:hypothetical protein
MKDDREPDFTSQFQLAVEAFPLERSRLPIPIVVQPDFSHSQDPVPASEIPQAIQGMRVQIEGIVGMDTHRGVELGTALSQLHGPGTGRKVYTYGDDFSDPFLGGTGKDRLQV